MKDRQSLTLPRREFLVSSSLFMMGTALLKGSARAQQAAPRGPDLPEELTPAELEIVNNSSMARDFGSFFGQGYSCSESGLVVILRYLKRPEEMVWVAGGFGGGLNHRDLCGFLTGSIMGIGMYAGTLPLDRKAAKEICSQKVNEFWSWWTSAAPLHCAEIREGRKDFKVCHRLGRLAAAKVEQILKAS